MNLTVLIEAKYIPDGSRVSKATGENEECCVELSIEDLIVISDYSVM